MTRRIPQRVAWGCCAGLIAAAAVAQQAAPREASAAAIVTAFDRDRSGAVDVNEYLFAQLQLHARADADRNLVLDLAEFRGSLDGAARGTAEQSLQAFDANANGKLDIPEFVAYHANVFGNLLDADRDGGWTLAEFEALRARLRHAPSEPSAAAPTNASPTTASVATGVIAYLDRNSDGQANLTEFMREQVPKFARFDSDGDGSHSKREFRDSLEERARRNLDASFAGFDRNGNGRLSQAEFESYHVYVFQRVLDRNRDGQWSQDELRD